MIIYLKRLKSSKFVRVKAFPMYGGIGVSAPSLHRESTDSDDFYTYSQNISKVVKIVKVHFYYSSFSPCYCCCSVSVSSHVSQNPG